MTLQQQFQFTPAAQRALEAAASTGLSWARIGSASLLAGLLAEPESRAAVVLAEHGVTLPAVTQRWPELEPARPPQSLARLSFAPPLEASLVDVVIRWSEFVAQVEVATEHLLLALLGGSDDVAEWLTEQGLQAAPLEEHWRALRGIRDAEFVSQGEELLADSSSSSGSRLLNAGSPLLRIVDAAANRAREALRVVEDYVRFGLDDVHLTAECKRMRHRLPAALTGVANLDLLAARDTMADVGTSLSQASERSRLDARSVVTANFKRLEESLRSLEEFTKVGDPLAAEALEQLRYQAYTLERAVGMTAASRERMQHVRLYVLLDGRAREDEFERLARSLVESGVQAIQLRDKSLGDRLLLDRARRLRRITREAGVLMIVNDRPDLAVLSDADGVHVGQEELSVKEARTVVGPRMLIGKSTHSLEQARSAVLEGANYLGVGPVFPSRTKSFHQFVGLELLKDVAREITLPALAIGGIEPANVRQVLEAGVTRIAVSAAVCEAVDPAEVVRQLRAALDEVASR